ncbi:hypothetical protein [Streptomyces sp. NPDC059072]|uniref:hypothetical protein n=1 Tax=Streptomyces sp. NPDC059072 TaxID=3346715 RepID=UPI00368FF328
MTEGGTTPHRTTLARKTEGSPRATTTVEASAVAQYVLTRTPPTGGDTTHTDPTTKEIPA